MAKTLLNQICKEYGLEVMDCILNELSKEQDFEKLNMVKHALDFLFKECAKETTSLTADEKSKSEYAALKNKLNTLLEDKKKQLKELFDIENIAAILSGE